MEKCSVSVSRSLSIEFNMFVTPFGFFDPGERLPLKSLRVSQASRLPVLSRQPAYRTVL